MKPTAQLTSTRQVSEADDYWVPLADLMTALMMVFLLIAIGFMIKVQANAARIDQIAIQYEKVREDLYNDLLKEFEQDRAKWGAEITRDLSVTFKEPDILFAQGSDDLRPRFIEILNDFFPRYVSVLRKYQRAGTIEEIRIEGHTSSDFGNLSRDEAYFANMELSQSRTRSTLSYALSLPAVSDDREWLKNLMTANGLSSSRPVYLADGVTEDPEQSRRVEFRVRTTADESLRQILDKRSK